MSYITDRLRPQLDCRQLAEQYGVKFRKRSSGWWLAHCFNSEAHRRGDRNPSLSINAQGYKCFSANCGVSGDAFSMIAHFEGLSLKTDFGRVLELASHKVGANYELLLLDERQQRERPHVRYMNPAQWRREMRKRERKRKTRRKNRLLRHGVLERSDALREDVSVQASTAPPKEQREDLRQIIHAFMVRTLDPATPPPHSDYFPDPFDDPFSIDPRHARLQIMQRLWSIVSPLDLSGQACAWLESRGIDPTIAHAYGCRDWSVASEEIRDALSAFSAEELEQAGLVRHQNGKRKVWTGLRALMSEEWAQGLGVPVIHPGWPVAPIAWRWRLFHPFKSRAGRTFKAIAQYSGEPRVPSLPLGMTPPTAKALLDVATWPSRTASHDEPRYAVVVCEGEPDWLSVAQVSAELDTDLYVVPVGLIAMSHGYPPNMSAILEGAERIVCVMDQGNTNKKHAARGGEIVVNQIRGTLLFHAMEREEPFEVSFHRIESKIVSALQDDDFDVNDLHKKRDLAPLMTRLLGDIL